MNIIIRISPFPSDNPSVFYPDDKYKLVNMCHESFLEAGGKNYDKIYIVDSCDWGKEFEKYGKVININTHNKLQSLLCAYETASKLEGKVLFLEDDYLWRPNTLHKLEFALDTLPVISPYDHPAHYIEDRFDKKYETRLIGDDVYRVCPSNTHTFATTTEILNKYWDIFVRHGINDHGMFSELNDVAQLWCPTYSFATHLATGCLAPNVNWREYLKTS